jgi:hypothetical protein
VFKFEDKLSLSYGRRSVDQFVLNGIDSVWSESFSERVISGCPSQRDKCGDYKGIGGLIWGPASGCKMLLKAEETRPRAIVGSGRSWLPPEGG